MTALVLLILLGSPITWIVLAFILFSLFPSLAQQTDEEIRTQLEARKRKETKEHARTLAYLKKYPPQA